MNLFFILPLIPLLGGSLTLIYHFRNQSTNLMTNVFILLSLFTSILLIKQFNHPLFLNIPFIIGNNHDFTIKLQIDNLSIIMLLLINFVSFIIHRYATNYLASDVTQGRFMAQLSILTGAVSLLVVSGNLLTGFISWQFIGFSLYLLLNHYHYDSSANKAAKKKFVINRIGDFCFLAAVILCYHFYANSDFTLISNNPDSVRISSWFGNFSASSLIILLIFVAIMTKSAQFPFHIWLPDTMQAPTPVSAIMHAGVINAGGFLLTRISPTIILDPILSDIIFTVGIITVTTASFFTLTQSDVKKQLAYSTMGQMGFMIMQCGLGLYTSAIFHLIAHGFFKAFLFLSAGNSIQLTAREKSHSSIKGIICILTTLGIVSFYYWYAINLQQLNIAQFISIIFISITMSQIMAEIVTMNNSSISIKTVLTIIILILFATYLFLTYSIGNLLNSYQYIPNKNFDNYKIIFGLLILGLQIIVWFAPLYINSLSSNFILYLYHLSRNKLFIENGYRKYLLNPYRVLGDYLNTILCKHNEIVFILLGSLSVLYTYFGISNQNLFNPSTNILINQILFIVMLIAANRALNIDRLNIYLFVAQLNLVNMGLFTRVSIHANVALFQIINSLLVFVSIILILRSRARHQNIFAYKHNLLALNSSYFGILLFLLIGLPGTASFISELNILLNLVNDNLLYIVLAGLGFIMLTIAILHALQEHVFNLNSEFLQKNIYLTVYEQLFIIFCIGFNIFNGIHPTWLLTNLSWT